MTDKEKLNIDPSKETVIGLKGSELHHDLKHQKGEKGHPDHAKTKVTKKDKEAKGE
jgi:hypothetical protein